MNKERYEVAQIQPIPKIGPHISFFNGRDKHFFSILDDAKKFIKEQKSSSNFSHFTFIVIDYGENYAAPQQGGKLVYFE